MTGLLAPGSAVTLGSQRWTGQAVSVELRLAAVPLLDVLTVRLPATAPVTAAPGDPAACRLDNGEVAADAFTGTVDRVRRSFDATIVTALGAGGLLARYRPATTYEQLSAGTVVRNLCGDVGVSAGDVDDGVSLAFYAADPGRTALDHVARLAAWSGATARTAPDGRLDVTAVDATAAQLALRFGREVLAADQDRLAAPVESFVVAGEAGAGDTAAPEALRPTSDFFGGNRPDGPSATARWSFEPALRTTGGAATAGAALGRGYRSTRQTMVLTAFLQPDLRPATVLEVRDLPDGMDAGPWWARRVTHRVSRDGALTTGWLARGGEAFDPAALLGSAAGALSGLL